MIGENTNIGRRNAQPLEPLKPLKPQKPLLLFPNVKKISYNGFFFKFID